VEQDNDAPLGHDEGPGGKDRHGNVRVVFLGNPEVVESFKRELARAGAKAEDPSEPGKLTLHTALLRRLFSGDASLSRVAAWPGSQVWFFTRAFDVAAVLPRLDADLVVVDERTTIPPSQRRSGTGGRARPRDRFPDPSVVSSHDLKETTLSGVAFVSDAPGAVPEGEEPAADELQPSSPVSHSVSPRR
jgi:hypothetical protein